MKVLHINSTTKGGAAIATIRIHEEMLKLGIDSNLLTLQHSSRKIKNHFLYDAKIINNEPIYPILSLKNLFLEKIFKEYELKKKKYLKYLAERKKYKIPRKNNGFNSFTLYSFPDSIYDITELEIYKNSDIIHLHWVSEFVDIPSFFSKNTKPIVWTLHDANPFLGGFHHNDDKMKNLDTHFEIENEIIRTKVKYISTIKNIKIVSPSIWLAEDAKNSEVFNNHDVHVIRNGIDPLKFRIRDKKTCRKILNLPINLKIFLIISSDLQDLRKGIDLIYETSEKIDSDFLFLICGSNFNYDNKENKKIKYFGEVFDEELISILYSSSDFTIIPSRLDNLPNILLESMMCGTPVISFNISDFKNIFSDNRFGILINEINIDLLANEINSIIENDVFFSPYEIRNYAINNFNIVKVCVQYQNIYESF